MTATQQTISGIHLGDQTVRKVFKWGDQVRPTSTPPAPSGEYIEYKMRADNSGNLYVPTGWYSSSWQCNCPYDWKVSIDWWTELPVSWTWGNNTYETFWWYSAWTSHTIKITPNIEDYWWAKAYWRYINKRSFLREVIYDGSYMWYAVSATDTGNYFRYYQYYGCTNLTLAPNEVLPDTVTTIWTSFRENQYGSCTSLSLVPNEVIPNSVTSIWGNFRCAQYDGCSSLTTAANEVLPNSVTTIDSNFRTRQYSNCSNLTTAANEVLPNSVTSIWYNFRTYQYSRCTSLTTAPAEVYSSSETDIWDSFRYYQYYGCTSLTTAATEALPASITTIWVWFREAQYEWCTSLLTTATEVFTNSVTRIESSFRRHQYYWCTSLTTASPEAMSNQVTRVWSYFRSYQYDWCSSLVTAPQANNGSIPWIGMVYNFRYYQFANCTSLEIWAEEDLPTWDSWVYGSSELSCQYRWCPSLRYIILHAWPISHSDIYFRINQFKDSWNNLTIKIVWNSVDWAYNSAWLNPDNVNEIQVPSALLSAYQSASNWSAVSSKFVWY